MVILTPKLLMSCPQEDPFGWLNWENLRTNTGVYLDIVPLRHEWWEEVNTDWGHGGAVTEANFNKAVRDKPIFMNVNDVFSHDPDEYEQQIGWFHDAMEKLFPSPKTRTAGADSVVVESCAYRGREMVCGGKAGRELATPSPTASLGGWATADAPPSQCVFPFTYNGVSYTKCTTVGGADVPWCAFDAVVHSPLDAARWMNCPTTPLCAAASAGRTHGGGSAAFKAFVESPSTHPLDLVVTWLNNTGTRYQAELKRHSPEEYKWDHGAYDGPPEVVFNPDHVDLCDTFVELKYALRSWEKHGLMDHVRHVYIVHSELHDGPCYLNESHPQLTFVRHSDMWLPAAAKSGLPTFNRNAILANIHRIPGLGAQYLFLNDDYVLQDTFNYADFIRGGGTVGSFTGSGTAQEASQKLGNWGSQFMHRSVELLQAKFGNGQPYRKWGEGGSHFPVMVWRPAQDEMAKEWPSEYLLTSSTRDARGSDLQFETLYQNYMMATDRGDCLDDDPEPGIHTNEWDYCPRPCDGYTVDASDAVVDKVRAWLVQSAAAKPHRWINLQGPGFDDAYRFRRDAAHREYSPKIETVVRAWFQSTFPTPSRFESK